MFCKLFPKSVSIPTSKPDSGSSAGLDSDYDRPPLEEDTDEPDSRQSPLRQEYNVTYPRLPPLEEESGLDVGMLTDFGNNLQNRINHPSRQDDTTIEHLTKSTSNIGYSAQAPSIDYEALFCFNLQENPKDSEINIFQRLGILGLRMTKRLELSIREYFLFHMEICG